MFLILFIGKVNMLKVPSFNVSSILNLLLFSIFASVLCFLMWNKAVDIIGAIKTTNYIYFVLLITMISSYVVINENITGLMLLGGMLIFIGVYINQSKWLNNIFKLQMDKVQSNFKI